MFNLNFFRRIILMITLLLNLSAFSEVNETQPQTTVYELISMTDQLSVLHELVETAGLSETLDEEGPITVFLPVNESFDMLPDGLLDSYMEDEEALRDLLTHHIFEGEALSADFEDGQTLEMMNGTTTEVSVSEVGLEIEDANIIQVDVDASNGVIHVVNQVMVPEN